MGQKTNPIGNRLGIIRGWDSNWYGGRKFEDKLVEDKIRKYLNVRLAKAGVSKIYIERTLKLVTVTINTARPGLIIGKAGQEVDRLKEELKKLTDKEVQINISEVKRPELDAVLVAATVAKQIEGRVSYRKAIKMAITSTMRVGAEGIKLKDIVPSTETGTSLRRKIQIQLLDNAGKVSTFYRWEGQSGKTWIAGSATTDMGDVEIPAGQGLWVLNTANCAATLRIPAPEL